MIWASLLSMDTFRARKHRLVQHRCFGVLSVVPWHVVIVALAAALLTG